MYVELHNYQDLEQKILFFKLKTIFNLDNLDAVDRKFIGIYIIYKDDVCLYVGQSTNLASRLATHIKGKYAEATKIYVLDIEEIGWSDFRERSKEAQTDILNNVEQYAMSELNPIENININHDFELLTENTPTEIISKEWIDKSFLIRLNKKLADDTISIESLNSFYVDELESIKEDIHFVSEHIKNNRFNNTQYLIALNGIIKGMDYE